MLCSIRFAHPSSERFWVLAHSDSVMVFQVDFDCKNVKLRGQIRGWMSNLMVPIYIFGDYNHHGLLFLFGTAENDGVLLVSCWIT